MHKVLTTTALAFAVTMLSCCQLNDHDSAPRAPDLEEDETAQSRDPASVARGGGRGNSSAGDDDDDPNTGDAGATQSGDPTPSAPATPTDAALPSPATFPGLEAGTATPVLPVLPGLEAGTLAPPNLGT
jgi:hypothetical protein